MASAQCLIFENWYPLCLHLASYKTLWHSPELRAGEALLVLGYTMDLRLLSPEAEKVSYYFHRGMSILDPAGCMHPRKAMNTE